MLTSIEDNTCKDLHVGDNGPTSSVRTATLVHQFGGFGNERRQFAIVSHARDREGSTP